MAAGGCKPRQGASERQQAALCRRRQSRVNHALSGPEPPLQCVAGTQQKQHGCHLVTGGRLLPGRQADSPGASGGLCQPLHTHVREGHPVLTAPRIFNFLLMKLFLEFLCIQKKYLESK